jgi:hypothetical protein
VQRKKGRRRESPVSGAARRKNAQNKKLKNSYAFILPLAGDCFSANIKIPSFIKNITAVN